MPASLLALTLGVGLSAVAVAPQAQAADGSAPSRPTRLTFEDQAHPMEVEGTPRFGWLPQDPDAGEIQTAYEIEVRDADGDSVWDSGKVTSGDQAYVDYAGAPLAPGATYEWTVRTWDRTDQVSPWAPEAGFDTGIGDADWGGAQWIRRQPGASTSPLQVVDGRGRQSGASVSVARTGQDFTDYDLDVDITPRNGSAGIVFRAPDGANGYMVALVPGTGVRHHVLVNGSLPNGTGDRITYPTTIVAGTTYHLTVSVRGGAITYAIDGTQVGAPPATTRFPAGTVGFRTANGEVADYDDLVVSAPDGTRLLGEDFSGDLSQWNVGRPQEADEWTFSRKQVSLPAGTITRARTWFAADDTYELWINGTRADRGTNLGYQGEQYYQAADVTRLLQAGAPTVLGVVSRWSGSGQGRAAGTPGLLGRMEVEYADGSTYDVTTDGTWRTNPADHVAVGTRNGEGLYITHQDARLTQAVAGWKQPGYDDSAWSAPVVLGAHPTAAFTHLSGRQTRLDETVVHPERILVASDGTPVADFGKVIPARPAVHFDNGVAGRTIAMRGSFLLDPTGRVSTSGVATQGTDMRWLYTQVDGPQDFAAFDHLGFRYLEIPGAGEDLTVDDVSATVLHTALPGEAATFTSNDPTLDAVWGLMQRSLLYSVQDSFVDTPTREQGQFLADTTNISYGLMASQGERVATRVAMKEFLLSQTRYWNAGNDAGRYNAVYPNGDGKRDIPDFTELVPDWVWRYYLETGDRDLLAQAYPAIAATADYVRRHIPTAGATAGLVTQLSGGSGQYLYGIVDWPESGRFGYDMTATARTTVNALGVDVLRTAGLMAAELARPATEVAGYTSDADALSARMNATLRRPDGTYVDGLSATGTQSAHAGQHATSYAIAFGIAPEADRPALARAIGAMGMKQGPMTSHWLLKALGDGGAGTELRSLLTNADDLGWAKVLRDGGTFTPEAWVAEGSANSLSHGWGSQAIVDIQQDVLGIDVTGAGASEVGLRVPETGLTHAAGSRPTQRGPVTTDWTRTGDDTSLTAGVPVNVTAVVSLPEVAGRTYTVRGPGGATAAPLGVVGGQVRYRVGSGTWAFTNVRATPPTVPPVTTQPSVSTTSLKVVRRDGRIVLVATVRPGSAVGGKVRFLDGRKAVDAKRVGRRGVVRLWLPRRTKPGTHRISAAFRGNATTLPSTSRTVKVNVVRPRR